MRPIRVRTVLGAVAVAALVGGVGAAYAAGGAAPSARAATEPCPLPAALPAAPFDDGSSWVLSLPGGSNVISREARLTAAGCAPGANRLFYRRAVTSDTTLFQLGSTAATVATASLTLRDPAGAVVRSWTLSSVRFVAYQLANGQEQVMAKFASATAG